LPAAFFVERLVYGWNGASLEVTPREKTRAAASPANITLF